MRIQPEYMIFKNRCTISCSYEFQTHQQRSQRRCCFSQNALLWFEVLPDDHRFVAGAPRCYAMQRDPSPGWQAACNSLSEGTRFRQSHQSRPEHPGVSDGNQGCCWCTLPVCNRLKRYMDNIEYFYFIFKKVLDYQHCNRYWILYIMAPKGL
jgi:hypothetical protein